MSQLKNFIAKMPIGVIAATVITDKKVKIPTNIDPTEFAKVNKPQVHAQTLTTEKAIHVASNHVPGKYVSSQDMLNRHLTNKR